MPEFTKILLPGFTNLESSSLTLKYFCFRTRLVRLRSTTDTYSGRVVGSVATSADRRAFEAEADDEAAHAELPISAGTLAGIDAREAEALKLGRAVAGFEGAAFLPRDGSDPRDAASGLVESSEDSEDEVEDSINSGDFCFVAGITAFFFGTVVGSGSTGTDSDTSDTDSLLGTRWRTGDVPLSSR